MKRYTVKIDKNEALRYLGCRGGQTDGIIDRQLDQTVKLLEDIAVPAYTYRVFKLERSSRGIELNGTSLILTGDSAAAFLRECHSCIMMAVTIGRKVDTELHRRQITNMAEAVILDSCASSAVESICNQLQMDLKTEYAGRGLFLTDRFSPGYGDLPLELQPEICRALNAEKTIGLSITGGMLMMPTKSVTAFIGISDRPQQVIQSGCGHCRMNRSCNYRKAGATCADY